MVNARFSISEDVIDAFMAAQLALAGDSNDDEHEALLALVEALEKCNLVETQSYDPGTIIEDFIGWAGVDRDVSPDLETIDDYVRQARPADSNPMEVKLVLCEWAEELPSRRHNKHIPNSDDVAPIMILRGDADAV